ncbi:TonB-dependent hemoglobin/transferrin/lactoferrin family receptor [Peteryoungia desertarenae]|uniref:TonB-dependent hemoglobin/transferrin/lactoferrin family receptor n=1 Tax=Peteryoungia desertarenae TaxID=1813451 RepID=A0ABX6QR82_9HYPH|nr:TonB-dependent hemoglobin/transferrin/lactoferrin family receptor [Peteryoungia desertarenae]QLF71045.1 TonB-dependent hemoglobin/transferrin/lactoferrin family receptor [Peteryoungia desertarenae]
MSRRSFRSVLLACTAITLALPAANVIAQDATASTAAAETQLDTIVVKGQRIKAGSVADTPLATETTAEEIRQRELNNARDLARGLGPGVDFVETKPGKQGGLFIRGLGGARVTTLIDNIPLAFFENDPRAGVQTTAMSDANNSYDFSSLSTIDVLRGADSSRIGSGALAGALVLRTLEPEDLIEGDRDWGGVAKATYDGEDKSLGGSVAVARKVENTSVLFQGSYKRGHERDSQGDTDILGPSRTKANPLDSEQNSVLLKVRQDLEGGHRIGVTGERFQLDTASDLKTVQSSVLFGPNRFSPGNYSGYDDTVRERISFDYSYEALADDAFIDAARLTAYWQRLSKDAGSFGSLTNNTLYARENAMQESSYGLTGDALSEFQTGNFSHELRWGGSFQILEAEQFLAAVPVTASQADIPLVDGTKFGFFIEDRIAFGETGFALTPGLRFDWYEYEPQATSDFTRNPGFARFGFPTDQSDSQFSPKLLATYDVTPDLQIYAQWSMAYRAPTVNELYVNFTNVNAGYANVGNPTLSPETGHGFELGAKYETTDLTAGISVYHNRYRNFIDSFTTTTTAVTAPGPGGLPGNLVTYRNRDNVEISGIELRGRQDFANGFFLEGSLAYAYGKDTNTGELIRTVAPFKSVLGVGYEQDTWGLNLTTTLQAGMREDGPQRNTLGSGTFNTFDAPGYGVVDLAGWWEPEQAKGLRIQAGVYNIFDKTYWNGVATRNVSTSTVSSTNQPVAFYSEPGRTFKISLTQKF